MSNEPNKNLQPSNPSWEGRIACQYFDRDLRLDKRQVKTAVNSYVYGLIECGSAVVDFDQNEITLQAGDFIIFPPQIPPVVLKTSEDYKAICLIVSSNFVYDCPISRNVFQTSTFSLINTTHPNIPLNKFAHASIKMAMLSFMDHLEHPHSHTLEALQSLYGLLLSDAIAVIEKQINDDFTSQHAYQLFIEFSKILRIHFRERHDITFYAEKLNISPRYLSMVTKQITHTTVATFINRHLMLEACWLLKTTDYSIQRISEILHFADQASFSKFFKRINGKNPMQYRREMESRT